MTYKEFVMNFLKKKEEGMPIYSSEISEAVAKQFEIAVPKAAAVVAVAIKRIIEKKEMPELRCYQKGIHYRAAQTPFGEIGIDKGRLIADKYLADDAGYETGIGLLHKLGLTTQIPVDYMIATNVAKDCVRRDKKLEVSICPPKTVITSENKEYLQTLDALELWDKAAIDAPDPYLIIEQHIKQKGLQYERLLYYAVKFYNRKTLIHLANTAKLEDGEK